MDAGAAAPTELSGEETWHPARLIPVLGIKGQAEQERRATSVLLAVMGAVPEFWACAADAARLSSRTDSVIR